MCTSLLGRQRQPRHQEVFKQSQSLGACPSIPAALWQWQWPLTEHKDGFQNTALGPLASYTPCSGRSSRCILMAAQWCNSSLAVVEFSFQTEGESGEIWINWSSQPKFTFDIFLPEPLKLVLSPSPVRKLAPKAFQVDILKWYCGSHLVTGIIDKQMYMYQVDLHLKSFSSISLICCYSPKVKLGRIEISHGPFLPKI